MARRSSIRSTTASAFWTIRTELNWCGQEKRRACRHRRGADQIPFARPTATPCPRIARPATDAIPRPAPKDRNSPCLYLNLADSFSGAGRVKRLEVADDARAGQIILPAASLRAEGSPEQAYEGRQCGDETPDRADDRTRGARLLAGVSVNDARVGQHHSERFAAE